MHKLQYHPSKKTYDISIIEFRLIQLEDNFTYTFRGWWKCNRTNLSNCHKLQHYQRPLTLPHLDRDITRLSKCTYLFIETTAVRREFVLKVYDGAMEFRALSVGFCDHSGPTTQTKLQCDIHQLWRWSAVNAWLARLGLIIRQPPLQPSHTYYCNKKPRFYFHSIDLSSPLLLPLPALGVAVNVVQFLLFRS